MGVALDLRAKILAQNKKNPDFKAPEFSAGPTSRPSEPGHKIFLDPKQHYNEHLVKALNMFMKRNCENFSYETLP